MQKRINLEVIDHVAHIRLSRSEKMNALDDEMMDALIQVGEQVKNDASIRVVVLSGDGKAFCAGLDTSKFTSMSETENDNEKLTLATRTHGIANRQQIINYQWRALEVPVIAVAQGFALGGGFQLFMSADIRYAAPGTRFSILEMRWGMIPDMGMTHVMTRVAGEDIVKELAMTARVFEVDDAKAYGFVTHVNVDPLARAMELAKEIANRNPEAVRGIKRLFNEPADRFLADTLQLESVIQDEIKGSVNQREAAKAEIEERIANFVDNCQQ